MPDRSRVADLLLAPAFGLVFGLVAPDFGPAPTGSPTAQAAAAEDPGSHDGSGEPIRVDGPVRFVVGETGILDVDGRRNYFDTVELDPRGPTLVNDLGMESYVDGVAEMPSRWPREALKAQAVAARTYAWYSIGLATFDGYDICATTACQVFRGADVVLEGGERWRASVEATAGEVLVDGEGEPILARYFSTSGGRTYANDDVFPSSGPRDYLVAIDDPDDAASPYHRWSVSFSREDFDELLSRGETLAATTPVAAVERLGAVSEQGASFRVTGLDGTEVEVGAEDLRDFLSRLAPRVFPERYPGPRSDGLRPLPTTVPSTRFEVTVEEDEVLIDGQGWGHGVGMGQYGARGRAERGEDYRTILATYYGGLAPSTPADLPDRIRVGLDAGDEHAILGNRPMRITDANGSVLVDGAIGRWTAERDGNGWRLTAPTGSELPLEVAATRQVGDLTAVDDAVTVETEVNKPVLLRLEVRGPEGERILTRELGTAEPGVHAATWRFVDDDGGAVPPGRYTVGLAAMDASGATAGSTLAVTVDAGQSAAAEANSGSEPSTSTAPWRRGGRLLLLALIALPLALGVLVLSTRKAAT